MMQALAVAAGLAQVPAAPAADLALVGGTIYIGPAEQPILDGVVLVRGGKIAGVGKRASLRVPPAAQSLDCSGRTIVAGFWNSHVHFVEKKWGDVAILPAAEADRQIQDMLTRHGFTSVFDLGSPWENTRRLRDRIESGEVPGPRIRSAGQGLVPPDFPVPSDDVLAMLGVMKPNLLVIADAAQAAAASRKALEEGVDGIKIYASSPPRTSLVEGAIRAAADEAHRAGKPVFVHCNSASDVVAALRGGADVVVHTTPLSPWDESIRTAMKERRAALNPTLHIWKHQARHVRISTQERLTRTSVLQLRSWVGAGGAVVFGTDIGAVDSDPAEEYALMADAGMTFRDILASLTTTPAGRFGDSDRLGRIADGFEADLVILRDDPAKNVRAFDSVQYTLRSGKFIYRTGE